MIKTRIVKIKASAARQTKSENHFAMAGFGTHEILTTRRVAFFFGISLPKARIGLHSVLDGRNQGAGREKIDHFTPPRLARSNGSLKLP
jgi:hypothetical protein